MYKNFSVMVFEKQNKYKDLEMEIEKNVTLKNYKTVPIVAGAFGLRKKGNQEQINKIPDAPGNPKNSSNKDSPHPVKSFVHLSFFCFFL